jgi:hypothetical protein
MQQQVKTLQPLLQLSKFTDNAKIHMPLCGWSWTVKCNGDAHGHDAAYNLGHDLQVGYFGGLCNIRRDSGVQQIIDAMLRDCEHIP